jgi:hypothetical protein
MKRTDRVLIGVLVLLACWLTPLNAVAGSITFTESFIATGSVNGTPFDTNVTFSLTTDTSLINGGETPNTLTEVTIEGIGSGTFTNLFHVFDNTGNSVAGFSAQGIEDIVDLSNPAFGTYDLKSPIGPLECTFFFTDDGVVLGSSLGDITFDSFGGTPTFTASEGGTTPEPGSFILFGTGIVGLAAHVRRRMKI